MSEQPETSSLRRPASLSVGLMAVGVAALGVRQQVVVRGFLWDGYRVSAAGRAKNMARFAAEHKPWPFPALQRPAPLHLREALGYGVSTGLTILMVGALTLTLIAVGRRRLWLPVAFGGLCLGQATMVLNSYADWASWVGVAAALAVVAAAAVPLLVATRGRQVRHRRILPAPLAVTALAGVLLADYVWVQHYNGPVQPRPAPTLALLVGAALLTASRMRRRWLPVLLVGSVLAVPQLQDPLGGLVVSGPAMAQLGLSHYQLGPLLFTIGVALAGAGIGRYGAQALDLWRSFAGRGPVLHLRRAENVTA
jgi:hypothetical protein